LGEEGQVIDIADREAVRAIEVGKSAGRVDVALIIVSGVERGVAGGSGVGGSGPGVGSLEVTAGPAARHGGLQRVIVRIGVVGKELVARVAIEARCRSTRNGIGKGVGG